MGENDEHLIRDDLHRLAGTLLHRSSNTESERQAAEYILGRMRESAPDARLDEFDSLDSVLMLYALYCTEFIMVGLLTLWLPWIAAGYGAVVLASFLAEITGYRFFSRLVTLYQTQNVVGRILAVRPRRQVVITAHYDTGRVSPYSSPRVAGRLRRWVFAIVLAMFTITAAAIFRGAGVLADGVYPVDLVVQWCGVAFLAAAGVFLVFCETRSEPCRGAFGNASGVAALLAIMERFAASPLEETDVWFIATGSKEGGLNGIRHALNGGDFDKAEAWILNLDYLGEDHLRYVTGEGLLATYRSHRHWVESAAAVAEPHGATSYTHRGPSTDFLPAAARGFRALAVTSTDDSGRQRHRNRDSDTLARLDHRNIGRAVDFAESVIRRLDARLSRDDRPRL